MDFDVEELDAGIALSLAWKEVEDARRWRRSAVREAELVDAPDTSLDEAIALSLQAALPVNGPQDGAYDAAVAHSLRGLWECRACQKLNLAVAHQCATCMTYVSPAAAAAVAAERAHDQVTAGIQRTRCGMPGCALGARHFGFCCGEHQQAARRRGLLPPAHEHVERTFIGGDGSWSAHVMTNGHPDRAAVKRQFLTDWRKQHYCDSGALLRPRVQRVLALLPPPEVRERFRDYQAAVGNSQRLFHGTGLASECDFGAAPSVGPCESSRCQVCSICRHGFLMSRVGERTGRAVGWLRYGRGLYFSSASGKSHDYAKGSERVRRDGSGRPVRWYCMFMCEVAKGRSFETKEPLLSDETIAALCVDSVTGVPAPGSNALNYDEIVTYTEASALPVFLIVYTMT
jgi:hypothetical protein